MFNFVSSGQPARFSARQVNEWNRTAEARKKDDDSQKKSPSSCSFNPDFITVQNKTGGPLGKFAIMVIGDPVNSFDTVDKARTDALNRWILCEGNKPTGGTSSETICITLQPIHSDGPVTAIVSGPACCVVDIKDTSHQFACPIAGETQKLESCDSGMVKILSSHHKTGESFCYILLGTNVGGSSPRHGVIVEAVSKPDDIIADILTGMGKIKFPGDEKLYDCGCKLLAETEQLSNEEVEAEKVVVDNPNYNPEQPESEANQKKKTYYLAINIKDHYDSVRLQADLTYGGTSTVKVPKGNDELEFTVHDGVLLSGQKYNADTPVLVHREGFKLWAVDGPCKDEEDEEETPI